MTREALQAEIDRGYSVEIVAEYPGGRDDTSLTYCVRSAQRALELLAHLRRLGVRPVAYLSRSAEAAPGCASRDTPDRDGAFVSLRPARCADCSVRTPVPGCGDSNPENPYDAP